MADDDGMLLNFDLSSGPVKSQVKFKGGKWRDRKRAERNAKNGTSGPRDEDIDIEKRLTKRRRLDNDGMDSPRGSRSTSFRPPRAEGAGKSQGEEKKRRLPYSKAHLQGAIKGDKQVISSLFSFNPDQKTTFEDTEKEEKWTAPEATNAPLADVANFGSLTISSRLADELGKMSIERPTAIQNKVIPHMLSTDADAFVQAETGSGKTFSYLLPILHRVLLLSGRNGENQIHRTSGIFAIIVVPTRELAKQAHTVLDRLIRPFPWLVSTAMTGGESKKAEKARLRKGVNFLVATPGRLADHIDNTKSIDFRFVRWLILDEGDRLMDLGFEDDLKKTINALKKVDIEKRTLEGVSLTNLPERRVTVLCSATMKMNVQRLGEMSLADATFLAAEKEERKVDDDTAHKAPAQLHQSHIIVPSKVRLVTLISYLRSIFSKRGKTMKAIVFMSCADSVDFHFELLKQSGDTAKSDKESEITSKTVSPAAYMTSPASPEVIVHRMHGSLSQPIRTATLKSFAACTSPSLLITTDVSSRGLDIPSVDLVVEYDPAFSFADHIHRVGRTARAGRPGDAMLFLLPGTEEGYIDLLKASAPPTAQSYQSILEKGLLGNVEFPVWTQAQFTEGQSYHDKAETLQLHLEQRLLKDEKQLDLARSGFKSHVRAYATHTKEERVYFDITELHLGHLAKSYGLREPPGGIGNGIDRKARKPQKSANKERDTDYDTSGLIDQKPARDIIRKKSMMLMSAGADEFNIG